MQIAIRSYVNAGVAVLGAGVIVAAPLAPPVHPVHLPSIRSGAMNLAAAVTPIDVYGQVLQEAAANLQTLAAGADPGQILKQILANQISSFTTLVAAVQTAGDQFATALTGQVPDLLHAAFGHLAAGDISAGVNVLLTIPLLLAQPAINLVPALERALMQPVQNLVNVAKVFADPLADSLLALGLLGPVVTGLGAVGAVVQNVVDGVAAGDLHQVGNAILTAPAVIADGVLNGGYGPDLGSLVGQPLAVFAGGLLSPGGLDLTPDGNLVLNAAGPIATLQQFAKTIAAALKPATAPTAEFVRTSAASVSVPAATSSTTSSSVTGRSAGKSPAPAVAAGGQSASRATKNAGGVAATRGGKRAAGPAAAASAGRSVAHQ